MARRLKNNPLDDIVKVSLEIANPTSSGEDFGSMLALVAAPANPPSGSKPTANTFMTITSAKDLVESYGYSRDEDTYKMAAVVFDQKPMPSKLNLFVREPEENVDAALDRANAAGDFYGVYVLNASTADLMKAATWVNEREKLLAYQYTDIESNPFNNGTNLRVFGMFSGNADGYTSENLPDGNKYAGIAFMARCFVYQPGSETWDKKEVADVVPSALTSAQKLDIQAANATVVLRYAGKNVTIGGKTVGGEWIDVIRFRDWLKNKVQSNVFAAQVENTKLPYTDKGIGVIKSAIISALDEGVAVGGIPETEFDSNGQPVYGYTVSVPLASEIPADKKQSRVLSGITFSARIAGAIHVTEISGTLTYSNIA